MNFNCIILFCELRLKISRIILTFYPTHLLISQLTCLKSNTIKRLLWRVHVEYLVISWAEFKLEMRLLLGLIADLAFPVDDAVADINQLLLLADLRCIRIILELIVDHIRFLRP